MKDKPPSSIVSAPVAERRDEKTVRHGIEKIDSYAWLRAGNWQEVMRDPQTLDQDICQHLLAENAYTDVVLKETKTLQDRLFLEMKGRIKEDDSTVPMPDGPWAYFISYVLGGQHPRYCRAPSEGGEEQVLIDGNVMARGKAYFQLGGVSHSHDHKILAYSADDKGSEYYTLRFRNAETGEDLPDEIPETDGGGVWSADNRWVYYIKRDENHRPRQLFRHLLGTSPAEDILVYDEPDPSFFVSVSETADRQYILLQCGDHQTSEVRLIDSLNPDADVIIVAPRQTEHEYSVDHGNGKLIIRTNSEGAEDFRIVEADIGAPQSEWREIETHRPGRLIMHVEIFREFMMRLERENGLPRLVIREWADGSEHTIEFDEEAYSLGATGGYEFDTHRLRFNYSSMTTPSQIYDYNMSTRERTLRKTQEVPSGHDPSDYVTRRVFATAEDGESIPVSLLYRRTTPLDGSAPLLLYGYGAYGISMPASFSTSRLSLVDRGFI
nr:S9 family peptidase [Hyphomicrobiales bacterium]